MADCGAAGYDKNINTPASISVVPAFVHLTKADKGRFLSGDGLSATFAPIHGAWPLT